MKGLVLFIIAFLGSIAVQAQDAAKLSKIKLKDGTTFKAEIVENIPGKQLTIKMPGNEGVRIDYENIAYIKHSSFNYHGDFALASGFYLTASTSLLFGKSSEYTGRGGIGFALTGNYRFNPYLSLGAGVEPTIVTGYFLMPVYGRISGSIGNDRVAPVYALDAGWSMAESTSSWEENSVAGGWFVRPSAGIRIKRFSIIIGYQVQKITTTSTPSFWWGSSDQLVVEERIMKNITAGVAFSFL